MEDISVLVEVLLEQDGLRMRDAIPVLDSLSTFAVVGNLGLGIVKILKGYGFLMRVFRLLKQWKEDEKVCEGHWHCRESL